MYWNCHTYFSFGYGTLSVAALYEEAKRNGVHKLVLTDINNTSAYIELLRICRERRLEWELEIAVGIEFRQKNRLLYVGLARNNEGFEELNRYLSYHNRKAEPFRAYAPPFGHVHIIYPFDNVPVRLRENEWVGVKSTQQNQLMLKSDISVKSKMVAWLPVTFRDKLGFNTHRLLRCIQLNTLLSKLDPDQQADSSEIMAQEWKAREVFEQFSQLVANAEHLVQDCSLSFDLGSDKNKRFFLQSKYEDRELLFSEARAGFQLKYGKKARDTIEKRFEKELEIIAKKNFEAYFLIAYDIIRYADSNGFAHVGRGSGANSLIAYCLGITEVDPIELDLYFERFLNTERSSPPDFDIDFSWKDRDKVIQYIFDRFGREHVSLLGTHTTFQQRSSLRELGKVFGLPKEEIDKIVQFGQQDSQDEITRLIYRYASIIKEIPRHLSIHSGGVLISEKPIYAYTSLDLPPKGFPVTHFEMHNAEDLGLFKFDILSQRGLGHIKDTVQIIQENQGQSVDITKVEDFKRDPKIKQLLRMGDCMGCFYVESPATRMLLGKLQCENYLTLVAASSIIRPGVARSGMMRAYIERHHAAKNGKAFRGIHPKVDELLKETYGVMVYQEDVLKVAHHFAGLTLTQADVLRRGMSGKYRSRKEFHTVKDQFFLNCQQYGHPKAMVDRLWFEIESFAGYSFAKGHSASFAVESFQSLYLKAHFPLEFMVGVINNFGGFYTTEFYFHEARMSGADVEATCINHSTVKSRIIGKKIYVGYHHLKALEQRIARAIEQERASNGPFTTLDNFIRRVPMTLDQIRILIRIGSFRFTGLSKKELLWKAQLYFGQKSQKQPTGVDLFEEEPPRLILPKLYSHVLEDAFDELDLLDFPLCDPFLLIDYDQNQQVTAEELSHKINQQIDITGYLVTTKDASTKNGQRMHFGTFYDYKGFVFDTINFPKIARIFPFVGRGFYRIKGIVTQDFGYPLIEVSFMRLIPMKDRWKTGAKGAAKLESPLLTARVETT
ncbi:MAG: DNA-directed DNA polymerase III PolC [Paraglaciecola sp.]|jgi:DNA-directed DNA polymerase III PolC